MKRREFITLLGGAAVAWPLSAHAQQPAMPVIGVLGIFTLDAQSAPLVGLRNALREAGFVEGRDVAIEYPQASDGQYDRLLSLASELVRRPAAVIVCDWKRRRAKAAKTATSTIPIVFANGSDPVRVGLVASMNRPGSNATGVSLLYEYVGTETP